MLPPRLSSGLHRGTPVTQTQILSPTVRGEVLHSCELGPWRLGSLCGEAAGKVTVTLYSGPDQGFAWDSTNLGFGCWELVSASVDTGSNRPESKEEFHKHRAGFIQACGGGQVSSMGFTRQRRRSQNAQAEGLECGAADACDSGMNHGSREFLPRKLRVFLLKKTTGTLGHTRR
jgi:hypothetical protein